MLKRVTSFCSIAVLAIVQTSIADNSHSPQVASYELDVAFFPERAAMKGAAIVRFNAPSFSGDSITWYLHGELRVDSVKVNGEPTEVRQDQVFYDYDYSLVANEAKIATAGALPRTLHIYYSGYFNPSQARSPSDYMRIDNDGVYLRAYGYSLWFPVFLPARSDDYPVEFTRVTARVPSEFTGIFGGTRSLHRVVADTAISEWSASGMRLFEAQFTARRYNILESATGVNVCYLPDSASTAAAHGILKFTVELITLYSGSYHTPGDAPQYFILEMPSYGDISSGSVTGLMESTWKVFNDNENAQRALAHELVHPYVHLDVPRGDSAYSLVVEGFPSFFHLPCVAKPRDAEFYNRFVGWMEKLYMDIRATGKDNRGNPMPPEKALLAITANELSAYKDEFVLSDRALLFLNYLMSRMGSRFDAFTTELFNSGVTGAGQLRSLIERYLPGSGPEITLWLETTEYPSRLHFSNFRMSGD